MRVRGETWAQWAVAWSKVWALFCFVWLIAGVGVVLWALGFRLPEDQRG